MKMLIAVLLLGGLMETPAASPANPMQQAVRAAHHHAMRTAALNATGPSLVDTESFTAASRTLRTGVPTQGDLLQAAGPNARSATRTQAIVCDVRRASGRPGCRVADNGLYIKLDWVQQTPAGFDALVTVQWTDRRASGSVALSHHTLRMSFVRNGNQWRLARTALHRQS